MRNLLSSGFRIAPTELLAAVCLTTHGAAAQAVGGRVVDSATRRPLPGVSVRLVRVAAADAAPLPADTTPLARSSSARDGVFMLFAPDTGRYRVRIGDGFVGPVLTLTSTEAFDQHEYPVTPEWGRTFFDFQVEKQAAVKPGTMSLHYPAELQRMNVEGKVVVQFVIDTSGRAEPKTFRVLQSTDPQFTAAARLAAFGARYLPAEARGRKVRQLVQLPLAFTLNGPVPLSVPLPEWPARRGDLPRWPD